MLKLPGTLRKNGTNLKMVMRSKNKAIFSQHDGSTLLGYEVIKIKVHRTRINNFLKRVEPEREVYPSTEKWGKLGWTCRTWERAIEKYNAI